jgi:hypothetical protein
MSDSYLRTNIEEYEIIKREAQTRGISLIEFIGEQVLGKATIQGIREQHTRPTSKIQESVTQRPTAAPILA